MTGLGGRLERRRALVHSAYRRASVPGAFLGLQVLVCGYLADRAELRTRLGIEAISRPSDGELLAHAYRRWGRDLQAHVLGEYAAVVVDPRADTALLTHDALGLAPLFYAPARDTLAFSTHVVDLVDLASSERLDEDYLADFLALGSPTTERTPFSAIRRLLPGQSLWWSDGNLHLLRSWNLADGPSLRCRDDGEYEERFRALLGAGVRAALETSGAAWSDLSGGLDSSSVVAVAAAGGAQRLAAVSVVSPGYPELDERRWMRAVVDQHEVPWHQLDIETMLPFSRLPDAFLGEPAALVIEAAQLRRRDELLAAHGVTSLLTGNGGDAVLCAFSGPIAVHLADPLFAGRPVDALRAISAWRKGSEDVRSSSYWLLRSLAAPAVAHLRRRDIRGGVRLPPQPWIDPGYVRRMRLIDRMNASSAPHCASPGRQHLWNNLWSVAPAATTTFQRPTAYDVRSPLMYRPLVEFMAAIPWEQKVQPRCDRYLQRRALAGVLPELVRRRASKADGSRPFIDGLRRSREWFAYLTDDPLLAAHGIAGAGPWRSAVRAASVGITNGDMFFLAGVAVETWLRQLRDHRRGLAAERRLSQPA